MPFQKLQLPIPVVGNDAPTITISSEPAGLATATVAKDDEDGYYADVTIDAKAYLKELGIEQTGLDKLIVASYKLLDLVTFLTSGEPETRAWTVKRGAKAPEAAGVIHTDFIKGFVKADVCNWEDFVKFNGWAGIKESGKLRLEGKDYEVKDGDTMYFHISA